MEVAVHRSGYVGCVRYDAHDVLQFYLVERQGYILQHIQMIVIGIQLNTRSVLGTQQDVGRYAPIVAQEEVVVVVHGKIFVTQYNLRTVQSGSDATLF